jgi:NAD-dependent DNA ligase
MKPRVMIDPININGVTVTYATGHNAKYIVDNKIGPGAQIQITRSGDVIPYILSVVKPAKKLKLPKSKVEWDKTGVNLYLVDKKGNDEVQIKRLTKFFSKLDTDFIKIGVITKLYEAGYDSTIKIMKLKPKDFLRIEGFKTTTANKLYESIQEAITDVDLPTLMDATGIFGEGLGSTRIAAIQKYHPNLLKLAEVEESELVWVIKRIPGFSDITASQFAGGIKKFYKWLLKTPITIAKPVKKKVVKNGKLTGQTVLFTGVRDTDLEAAIEANGGRVATGFSSSVTYLLAKDPNSTSSKAQSARNAGVPILTLEKFKKKFGL